MTSREKMRPDSGARRAYESLEFKQAPALKSGARTAELRAFWMGFASGGLIVLGSLIILARFII